MVPTTVVNIKRKSSDVYRGLGKFAARYVYIGRPTIWGNPFTHLTFLKYNGLIIVPTQQAAVDEYDNWLEGTKWKTLDQDRRKKILKQILELDGKVLGCYCVPGPCHGHVLVRRINERKNGS